MIGSSSILGRVWPQARRAQAYRFIPPLGKSRMAKPITSMTVDEVIENGPWRTKNFGSSACGRYQFMTATLKGLRDEGKVSGRALMSPTTQDELGYALLVRRGYAKFMAGKMSVTDFGNQIAMEWASFPVLASTRGANRDVARGETYYAGDQLNKVLTTPAMVLKVLAECTDLDTPDDDAPVAQLDAAPGLGIMSVPIASLPDPAVEPIQASREDPTLIAPETPFKGLLSLFQGKPPVPKGDRKDVTAAAKEEAPSLMKDLAGLRTVGIIGGVGSMLGGANDSGLLDTVKSTADNATATFQSVQSLTNILLGCVKWGVTHWWLFGLGLTAYVLVKVGWAIFKLYVMVKNNIKTGE